MQQALTEDVSFAKDAFLSLGIRLHSLGSAAGTEKPEDGDLQQVATWCHTALGTLDEELSNGRRSGKIAGSRPPTSSMLSMGQVSHSHSKSTVGEDTTKRECSSIINKWGRLTSTTRWADRSAECHVCFSLLGKRYFNPRHHCRVCEKSICAACSPSRVQLDPRDQPARVCSTCASRIYEAPHVEAQLHKMAWRLAVLRGASPTRKFSPGSVEQAVQLIETEISNLETETPIFTAVPADDDD